MAYPNTNVFILCFSVVDPDSYSNILSKWIPELNRNDDQRISSNSSHFFQVMHHVFQLFSLEQNLIYAMILIPLIN